ncbi:MAG TPA: hypothetical protein DCZ13_12610 [Porticoccaceae bacterium]|nr:hypothetical protein [Porticoccaceae bacterium]
MFRVAKVVGLVRRVPAIALAGLLGLPFAALGQFAECRTGEFIRQVEVVRQGMGKVPCEVHYRKINESSNQVLWTAQNDPEFCDIKFSEFVDKLSSHGWNCNVKTVSGESSPEVDLPRFE